MRIDPSDSIAGVRLVAVRDFLRRLQGHGFTVDRLAERLDLDPPATAALLDALHEAGYVTPAAGGDGTNYWSATVAGNQLAMASAARPVRRSVAQRHLDALLERARAVDADPDALYWVTEVVLFGSMLDPDREHLNDVDVAVRLTPRFDGETQVQAMLVYAEEQIRKGRRTPNYTAFVTWAYTDLRRYLKSGSRVLSVHDLDDEAILDRAEHRTGYVFDPDGAPPAYASSTRLAACRSVADGESAARSATAATASSLSS